MWEDAPLEAPVPRPAVGCIYKPPLGYLELHGMLMREINWNWSIACGQNNQANWKILEMKLSPF
jgi:hypothetical protein